MFERNLQNISPADAAGNVVVEEVGLNNLANDTVGWKNESTGWW